MCDAETKLAHLEAVHAQCCQALLMEIHELRVALEQAKEKPMTTNDDYAQPALPHRCPNCGAGMVRSGPMEQATLAICGDAEQLLAEVERLRAALKQIAWPIDHLREQAARDGLQIDGMMACQLAADANYLRGIAEKAYKRAEQAGGGE